MQTTYLKQTASMLLKTAHVGQSLAGCYEIWVTVPKMGKCIARLQTRQLGWGDNSTDVLVLDNGGEMFALTTTPKSLAKLEELVAECEAKQLAALRAEGVAI